VAAYEMDRGTFFHLFGMERDADMNYRKYRAMAKDELKNPDYTHIRSDLRRIFLIAVFFISVMVVLSFVIK
jgi:hypothetical protein